jgi:DNA relaxase NicK
MLVASGGLADDVWSHAVALGYRASRIDLAVTAWFDPPRQHLALDAYKLARDHTPANGRPPAATYLVSSLGGSTCYVGSRSSETFGRLYDKHAQSQAEPDRGAWRWEVELKAERAASAAIALLDSRTHRESIRATVWEWFTQRGIQPPWDKVGEGISTDPVGRQADDTRRAEWLATQVAPTVRDLIPRIGMEAVLEALGLDPELFIDENRSGAPRLGAVPIRFDRLTPLRRGARPQRSNGGS